jgi:hypothetical protein
MASGDWILGAVVVAAPCEAAIPGLWACSGDVAIVRPSEPATFAVPAACRAVAPQPAMLAAARATREVALRAQL